jgi:predicted permease
MPEVAIALAKALSSIFLVGIAGGLLVRRKVISQRDIESLSNITVMVLLPCLMFSKINQYFKPEQFTYWWLLPLAALLMMAIGLLISYLFYLKQWKKKKHYLAMSSIMNANYMVLPIAQIAFADHYDLFAAFCFLFVIGVNPTLWSLGKYLITNGNGDKVTWRTFITPPLISTLISLILVLTSLNQHIPQLIVRPVNFIGEALCPWQR